MTEISGTATRLTDVRALADPQRGPKVAALFLVGVLGLLAAALIYWAQAYTLEIWATGIGKVIPSSQIQVVQNLEGGIVREILVKEGDRVAAGQEVARIDGTDVESSYQEDLANVLALTALTDRLAAEASGQELVFSEQLKTGGPEADAIMADETAAYRARRANFEAERAVLEAQRQSQVQAAADAAEQLKHLKTTQTLLEKQIAVVEPQVKKGLVSETELLRLLRDQADGEARAAELLAAINKARSAEQELTARLKGHEAGFRSEAFSLLAEKKAVLAGYRERLVASHDKVVRRSVKAPVAGVVKKVLITTPGEVVKPGDTIVEFVPSDDDLLVEAHIRPEDIGFIRPGQEAKVRLTAYDFSIYGAMTGTVERVGADTQSTRDGESFYPVVVRVGYGNEDGLPAKMKDLEILPGMIAQVSIVTGERTILEYVFKPILKVKEMAFRDR